MTKRPLEGIRVADFSWYGAGPIAANTLATFGAEVVRVESEVRVDGLRLGHPFAMNADGTFKTGYNVSGYFNNFNAGKLSMQLNVNSAKGQEVAYQLVEKSDIFITNVTPRVVDKWNVGYEKLKTVNPRIIAAYAPMQGMEGPHRDFLGFGAVLTPVTGLSEMSGFPHRRPIGIGSNYPDYVVNPGHTITAILAALRYRNRSGLGQMVELPQIESVVNTLGTAVANYLANGANTTRTGNRNPMAAPHGAFRCADDPQSIASTDRWVAIACYTDEQWRMLCALFAHPEAANDDRFAMHEARRANEDAIEALVGEWTRDRVAEDVMAMLQSAAIPCGVVHNAQDNLSRDPHMLARGYYQFIDHPETGRAAYDGPAARLSETPGYHHTHAPLFGEHTMDVCERILGMDADEIADLMAEGVLL